MRPCPLLPCLLAAFALLPARPSPAATPAQPKLPRYQFVPGQVLSYHEEYSTKAWRADRSSVTDTNLDLTVRVSRKNSDGSYRLVFAMRDTTTKTARGQTTEDKSNSLFYADVFPDGRELPIEWSRFAWTPGAIFPPLPAAAEDLKTGWKGQSQDYEYQFKPAGGDAGLAFDGQVSSPDLRLLGDRRTVRYTWDERGFVGRIDDAFTRTSNVNLAGSGVIQLRSVSALSPSQLATFAEDADTYFATVNAYDALMKKAQQAPPDEGKMLTDSALATLRSGVAKISDADLKSDAQDRLSHHDEFARDLTGAAADRAARIGKPAPAFQTTDINGGKISMADLRGKVVVLDFWYRGCVWCAKSVPQLNQLSADFAKEPVAVMGMSVDHDPADSRKVIEQLGITYPTLRAEGLADSFGVRGYPTLIVIDRAGVVRKIEDGFSPTMREDLTKQIRQLMNER